MSKYTFLSNPEGTFFRLVAPPTADGSDPLLAALGVLARESVLRPALRDGGWAVRYAGHPSGFQVTGWWAGPTLHSAAPLPGRAVNATLLLSTTTGAQIRGVTADDLPDDAADANAFVEQVAQAQGVAIEPVRTLWLVTADLSDDAGLRWASANRQTGQVRSLVRHTGGAVVFPKVVAGLGRLLYAAA